jgi:hypothetical protein
VIAEVINKMFFSSFNEIKNVYSNLEGTYFRNVFSAIMRHSESVGIIY